MALVVAMLMLVTGNEPTLGIVRVSGTLNVIDWLYGSPMQAGFVKITGLSGDQYKGETSAPETRRVESRTQFWAFIVAAYTTAHSRSTVFFIVQVVKYSKIGLETIENERIGLKTAANFRHFRDILEQRQKFSFKCIILAWTQRKRGTSARLIPRLNILTPKAAEWPGLLFILTLSPHPRWL